MPVGLFLPGPGPYNARNPERGVAAVAAALNYEATILADGPALYWRLGELVGTTAEDETVNNRDGTYSGSYVLGASSAMTDPDASLDLRGGFVTSTYNPFANGVVRTYEGWANRRTSNANQALFGGTADYPATQLLRVSDDGISVGQVEIFTGANTTTWASAWPGKGRWVHWVLVHDVGNTVALYINGALVSSQAWSHAIPGSPGNFQLGAYFTIGNNPWDGLMDEVAVYEYGLSAGQVLAHYNAGQPTTAPVFLGSSAGLSAATLAVTAPVAVPYQTYALSLTPSLYWALNATTGVTDLSGSARNGSGQGGIAVGANGTSPLNGGSASTDFDGSDDYVESTYNPFTNGTGRSFAGWAWRDNNTAEHCLIGGSSNYPDTLVLRQPIGSNDVDLFIGATNDAWAGAWPGTGQWVHWALTFNESTDTAELFINGSSVGTKTRTETYPATPGNFKVGAYSTTGNAWDGRQVHVGVWERVLTAVEVANLYASRLPPGIESLASAGQSSATLALSAPAKITLATSAAQSAATLALTAPAKVTLATSAAVSSATLALSAPTQVPLATAACVASATCAVSIPSAAVEVPLAAAACQSSATLALSAPTQVPLQTSAAQSAATLALSAKPTFTLSAAAVSSATLALSAQTRVTLGTSAAQSAATLALTAPTRVVLGTAAATSAATLALSAPTRVVLGSATAQSAATLSLTAPTRVTLGTAPATSSATLALSATTQIPLQTSAAVASATLGLTAGGAPVPLGSAAAMSSATFSLKALTQIPLVPSAAQSSTTLAVTVATRVVLQSSAAASSATLSVSRAERVTLGAAAAVSSATLSIVILSPTPDTNPDLGGEVEENATGGEVEEVLTGGTPVANITGGIPVATVTSGIVNEVLTGGTYDEVLTGGEPDDTTGGDPDLVSTGGEVNVVLTGGVVNEVLTGGTYDETLTGGDVQEVPTGDSPDESQRGGDYDLVLTGGEVL